MTLQATRPESYRPTQLTKRETQILFLMANEKRANEIATELNIGEATVRSHRKNLYSKLDVSKSAGAVRKGFEFGYLRFSA